MDSAAPISTTLGTLAGRMEKVGTWQPKAAASTTPNRPLVPGEKPKRSARERAMGINRMARPMEDGMTKPNATPTTITPTMIPV